MQNEPKERSDGGRGGEGGASVDKCAAKTRNGRPCRGLVRPGSDYCPAHDPARQEARRKAASKAARSKPGGETQVLKGQLKTLTDDVLDRRVDPKAAAVATQIANAYTRILEYEKSLLEFEKKYKEQEEFQARMAALEEVVTTLEEKVRREQEVRRAWESQNIW